MGDAPMLFARVITIIAVVMGLGIPVWAIYYSYRKRKLLYEERRLMIEKGMVPPPLPETMPWETKPVGTNAALEACLRRGVILVVLGIGLGIGLVLLSDNRELIRLRVRLNPFGGEIPDRLFAELAVAGLMIGLTGLGNLAYYAIARKRTV